MHERGLLRIAFLLYVMCKHEHAISILKMAYYMYGSGNINWKQRLKHKIS